MFAPSDGLLKEASPAKTSYSTLILVPMEVRSQQEQADVRCKQEPSRCEQRRSIY